MSTSEPTLSDRSRGSPFHLLSPAIAGALVIMGLLQFEPYTIFMGVGLGLFVWLTRHARYEIFHDRLVVRFAGPRQKILPLAEIEQVELVKIPMGGQGLFVRRKSGLGMVIQPTNPEQFAAGLEEARRGLEE